MGKVATRDDKTAPYVLEGYNRLTTLAWEPAQIGQVNSWPSNPVIVLPGGWLSAALFDRKLKTWYSASAVQRRSLKERIHADFH